MFVLIKYKKKKIKVIEIKSEHLISSQAFDLKKKDKEMEKKRENGLLPPSLLFIKYFYFDFSFYLLFLIN